MKDGVIDNDEQRVKTILLNLNFGLCEITNEGAVYELGEKRVVDHQDGWATYGLKSDLFLGEINYYHHGKDEVVRIVQADWPE